MGRVHLNCLFCLRVDPSIRRIPAHGWWRHHNGGYGWVGPLFWPFAYYDLYDYTLWGDYDDAFWNYGYDDVYAGLFSPYGSNTLAGYLPQTAQEGTNENEQVGAATAPLAQMCGSVVDWRLSSVQVSTAGYAPYRSGRSRGTPVSQLAPVREISWSPFGSAFRLLQRRTPWCSAISSGSAPPVSTNANVIAISPPVRSQKITIDTA